MSDSRSISGPVKVNADHGSPERVAYDLARDIAVREKNVDQSDWRKYALDLYAECLIATRGFRDA